MNKEIIDRMKEEGANQAIRSAIRGRVWSAKNECEKLPYEGFKDFGKHLTEARRLLDEAEQLYNSLNGDSG